jgi:predicted acylesterase/phospholipase RssA
MRRREFHKVLEQMRECFQEWLDRGGVGDEVLGAEPLSLLIAEHVLPKVPGAADFNLDAPGFEQFIQDGIVLLATATNLTGGRLEILGEILPYGTKNKVSLRQGLLASSAFPGVFRPRWHWEVRPGARDADLFSDGGVMDNLPFDAVARFLNNAALANLIATNPVTPRGSVPHLVFSASLRADPVKLEDTEVRDLKNDWIRLRDRTRRLGYNQKLKLYEEAQRAIRRIRKSAIGNEEPAEQPSEDNDKFTPLDLEILTIRPNWLCGTFSFHPMLGFRRKMQARSIAHGCASTLLELGARATDEVKAGWLEEWGVDLDVLPKLKGRLCKNRFMPIKKSGSGVPGGCWFNQDIPCTFSQMSMMDKNIPDEVSKAVYQIYKECERQSTHLTGK